MDLKNTIILITAFLLINIHWFANGQENSLLPKKPVSVISYENKNDVINSMPLTERIKRKVVPQRGLCNTAPGTGKNDLLMSGNGIMQIQVFGNPVNEQVIFCHEKLLVPWATPPRAPDIAYVLPKVKELLNKDMSLEILKEDP